MFWGCWIDSPQWATSPRGRSLSSISPSPVLIYLTLGWWPGSEAPATCVDGDILGALCDRLVCNLMVPMHPSTTRCFPSNNMTTGTLPPYWRTHTSRDRATPLRKLVVYTRIDVNRNNNRNISCTEVGSFFSWKLAVERTGLAPYYLPHVHHDGVP